MRLYAKAGACLWTRDPVFAEAISLLVRDQGVARFRTKYAVDDDVKSLIDQHLLKGAHVGPLHSRLTQPQRRSLVKMDKPVGEISPLTEAKRGQVGPCPTFPARAAGEPLTNDHA